MSQPDNFEAAASDAATEVASFDEHEKGVIGRVHHALHTTPSLVPLIVLLAAIVIFGLTLGDRFFSPFAMTLILQQVQIVGIVAAAGVVLVLLWLVGAVSSCLISRQLIFKEKTDFKSSSGSLLHHKILFLFTSMKSFHSMEKRVPKNAPS